MRHEEADIAIVGAGAAGLTAAIFAGETQPGRRIVVLDGARRPGAKILVAGGGRCNVTHDHVDASDYAGSSPNTIRKVLRRFDVEATVAWFDAMGVQLKREPTGKLFPTTDDAHTVLRALWQRAQAVGADLRYPRRVASVAREANAFLVSGTWGTLAAKRLVLATGGCSLPRSGSDGSGFTLARMLGHSLTPHVLPALVPLVLPDGHFLRSLSGLAAPARVEARTSTGRLLRSFEGDVLCTHFGLSGPAILDVSRHLLVARQEDAGAHLTISWLPDLTSEALHSLLQQPGGGTIFSVLRGRLPERLLRALCSAAGTDSAQSLATLTRAARQAIVTALTALKVDPAGHRGFSHAETTAGGVPLAEIDVGRMESRCCPGLHLCGEICDVDGRIGGFNFQWAWASGYVAGASV